MNASIPSDTVVTFADDGGQEYACETVRLGHTDHDVIAVAYRWACLQVAEGAWQPEGQLRYRSIRRVL